MVTNCIINKDCLFGGKIMLFGGDFRQVLPVVRKGRREDVVDASLCHSFIWKYTEVLRLTENMRLINRNLDVTERGFAKWLLDIGNGDLHADSVSNDITLPQSMLLEENSIQSLIDFIYPNMSCIDNFVEFFQQRGILAPKNKDVDIINSLALHRLRGATKEYLSVDSIC